MKHSLKIAFFHFFYASFFTQSNVFAASVEIGKTSNVEWFVGVINPESVAKFITKMEGKKIDRIGLISPGGDVGAAIALARWIKQRDLDVQVRTFCISSCANYLFIAGKNKYIESEALISWHGSVEQKNFRNFQTEYENIKEKSEKKEVELSEVERRFLIDMAKKYVRLKEIRELQQKFFSDMKVDEEITRLGQEPILYSMGRWTASTAVMKKYGITNVFADDNYGKFDYMKNSKFTPIVFRKGLLSFDLDEQDKLIPLIE
ncbi:hypothetical protein H8L32_23245 [Undibacterium sp. CY18W]|uniref:Uncharacterized protein n=1 Tax=Undibacterium hunanense TaxID=2762292 RepID=A0ABR6ZXL4_9BURK|nr:hypothetical protein [Undibacterium hunanense]MBC3920399.1 hypothetical protein [Undibacterium hunanense]